MNPGVVRAFVLLIIGTICLTNLALADLCPPPSSTPPSSTPGSTSTVSPYNPFSPISSEGSIVSGYTLDPLTGERLLNDLYISEDPIFFAITTTTTGEKKLTPTTKTSMEDYKYKQYQRTNIIQAGIGYGEVVTVLTDPDTGKFIAAYKQKIIRYGPAVAVGFDYNARVSPDLPGGSIGVVATTEVDAAIASVDVGGSIAIGFDGSISGGGSVGVGPTVDPAPSLGVEIDTEGWKGWGVGAGAGTAMELRSEPEIIGDPNSIPEYALGWAQGEVIPSGSVITTPSSDKTPPSDKMGAHI